MQTTLSGTIYVYQGEELGQRNMPPDWDPSEYKDVETINYWNKVRQRHSPVIHHRPSSEIVHHANGKPPHR